jgi:hypothetical protein
MAEACYTARATIKQQVLNGVNKLTFQTNEHGQYTYDAIQLLQKGIRRVLISQFNPRTQATRARAWRSYSMTAIICSHW